MTQNIGKYKTSNLQFKGLVKKGIEVAAFDLSAARLYHRKNVLRLQTQLHKWITETWKKHQSIRPSRKVVHFLYGCNYSAYSYR